MLTLTSTMSADGCSTASRLATARSTTRASSLSLRVRETASRLIRLRIRRQASRASAKHDVSLSETCADDVDHSIAELIDSEHHAFSHPEARQDVFFLASGCAAGARSFDDDSHPHQRHARLRSIAKVRAS